MANQSVDFSNISLQVFRGGEKRFDRKPVTGKQLSSNNYQDPDGEDIPRDKERPCLNS
jgi:hypothetical protein